MSIEDLIAKRYGVTSGAVNPLYSGYLYGNGYWYDPNQWRPSEDSWQRLDNEGGWTYGAPVTQDDGSNTSIAGGIATNADYWKQKAVSAPTSIEEALGRYNQSNFDVNTVANLMRQYAQPYGLSDQELIAGLATGGNQNGGYTEGSNYQGIALGGVYQALADKGGYDMNQIYADTAPLIDQGSRDAYDRWKNTQDDNSWWARFMDFGNDVSQQTIGQIMGDTSKAMNAVGMTGLARQTDRATNNLYGVANDATAYYTEHPEMAALTAAGIWAAAAGAGAGAAGAAGAAGEGAGLAAGATPAVTGTWLGNAAGALGAPQALVGALNNPLVANAAMSLIRSGITGQPLEKALAGMLYSTIGGVAGGMAGNLTSDYGSMISGLASRMAAGATTASLNGADPIKGAFSGVSGAFNSNPMVLNATDQSQEQTGSNMDNFSWDPYGSADYYGYDTSAYGSPDYSYDASGVNSGYDSGTYNLGGTSTWDAIKSFLGTQLGQSGSGGKVTVGGVGSDLLGGLLGYLGSGATYDKVKSILDGANFKPYNVYGPSGSVVSDGGNTVMGLSPEMQAVYDRSMGYAKNQMDQLNQYDPEQMAQTLTNKYTGLFANQDAEQKAALESRLFNQGRLGLGTVDGSNPEMLAYYRALGERNAKLGAQAYGDAQGFANQGLQRATGALGMGNAINTSLLQQSNLGAMQGGYSANARMLGARTLAPYGATAAGLPYSAGQTALRNISSIWS